MAVTVHIDQTAIDRAFAEMEPSAARHKTAIRKAGVALSLLIQETLRQQGKDYYDGAADATAMEETAEGVSVSIAWRGIGLNCLLVGDSLSSDIRGANNYGLPCCWYNPKEAARPEDLRIDYEIRDLRQLYDLV